MSISRHRVFSSLQSRVSGMDSFSALMAERRSRNESSSHLELRTCVFGCIAPGRGKDFRSWQV